MPAKRRPRRPNRAGMWRAEARNAPEVDSAAAEKTARRTTPLPAPPRPVAGPAAAAVGHADTPSLSGGAGADVADGNRGAGGAPGNGTG